jgi:hypothetical protein
MQLLSLFSKLPHPRILRGSELRVLIAPRFVPSSSPRNMKWKLHRVFPLLLATAAVSLPSGRLYRNDDELHQAAFQVQGVSEDSFLEWGVPPHPNSTHHLIFNSVSAFLQRWPNTLRRNGALDPCQFTNSDSLRHAKF